MLKLLPNCDEVDLSYKFEISHELKYVLTIVDSSRYTSTVKMSQRMATTPKFMQPSMLIRLYHDARVAEVIEAQRTANLAPAYDYPNIKMHLRNEKFMVNVFLAEWLHFCLTQGSKTLTS